MRALFPRMHHTLCLVFLLASGTAGAQEPEESEPALHSEVRAFIDRTGAIRLYEVSALDITAEEEESAAGRGEEGVPWRGPEGATAIGIWEYEGDLVTFAAIGDPLRDPTYVGGPLNAREFDDEGRKGILASLYDDLLDMALTRARTYCEAGYRFRPHTISLSGDIPGGLGVGASWEVDTLCRDLEAP